MKRTIASVALGLMLVLSSFSTSFSASDQPSEADLDEPAIFTEGPSKDAGEVIHVPDPLEPYNRLMYKFNDKLYFWVLKPVAKGYKKVAPEVARKSIHKLFSNVTTPIRLVNCGLQGKLEGSAIELTRFFVNSTLGVAGLFDPAKSLIGLEKQEEDFDQTLGKYGLGPGLFIVWPFWGPSSARGTVGMLGDWALDPTFYLTFVNSFAYTGVTTFQIVNDTSLTLGDYEDLIKAAIDPYISIRDAYFQNRRSKIKDKIEDKIKE